MRTRILVVTTATLLILALSACKIEEDEDSGALTYLKGDDFLKVAVNHIGANCEIDNAKVADSSHYLNGPNGEIMLQQAAKLDRGSYGFSGDAVMGRTSAEAVTKMEDIEAKCRRLILSVDVAVGHYPSIHITKGSTLKSKKAKFEGDFGKNNYGTIDCMEDTITSFCNFANIPGKNNKKRWFTYLEPDNDDKIIQGTVHIMEDSGGGSDTIVGKYPITLNNIYREKLTLSSDLQAYLESNCLSSVGHGGNLIFTSNVSGDTSHDVHGRTYPGRFYSYRYLGNHVCENKIYGLEDPRVVQYLKYCGASCIKIRTKGSSLSQQFALQFEKHNLRMDCQDDAIGFHVEDNALHWTESEGTGMASGWYNCNNRDWGVEVGGAKAKDAGVPQSLDGRVTLREGEES